MRRATNLFLINSDGRMLISMKKRGLGAGKWNGTGGKLMPEETPEQAAVREAKEEIGVDVDISDLEKIGEMTFKSPDPNWGMFVYIYRTKKWRGEPKESEEMRPEWHNPSNFLETHKTWPDMPHYFGYIVKGEKFKGEFVYKDDSETLDHFHVVTNDVAF